MAITETAKQKPVYSRNAAGPVRWLVMFLEVGFVVLIAYFLAGLVYEITGDNKQLPVVSAMSGTRAATLQSSHSLIEFDPFFRRIEQENVPATRETLPESTLQIEVFGLRTDGDGEGSAIVKVRGGQQKLVTVGDELASGIKLVGVYVEYLELSRAGAREAVFLKPKSARTGTGNISRKNPAPGAVAAAARARAESRVLQQSVADDRISQIIQGLKALKLSPVRRQNKMIGFRLPEQLPQIAAALGLEGQDILLSVNGEPMTSFERLEELEDEISGARELIIQIERRGEKRRLAMGL